MQKYYINDWEWYLLKDKSDIDLVHSTYSKQIRNWHRTIEGKRKNYLQMNTEVEGRETLSGSLIYHRDIDSREDSELFHFFLTNECLITLDYHDDSLHLNRHMNIHREIKRAVTPIEGFMIILGSIMTEILYRIDGYEERLDELIWNIKENNSIKTLEKVYQSRHEILIWKNVMMPFLELKIALVEAFSEDVLNGKEFKRIGKRIKRGLTLVDEYEKELNNLVHFEEVVSQHRGNEIMKTLTVLTTLCTPIMAWGALWGMNFKFMPELEWKLGYPLSLIVIVISTISMLYYLKTKGWMGDLLKSKKRNSFFR
ncbi:magnesium transporter CorA family protein [Niallia sp. 03133]|uniref:magnesium transporter CorA family protein n=1 Tax=Niallia sp. 03133 TaxID=3458060 RepID=UPI0040446EA7